jgi:hypothetical protein
VPAEAPSGGIASIGILVIWAFLALIPAAMASSKGRSAVGWFFAGLLLSPILAAILVAIASNPRAEEQRHAEMLAATAAMRPAPPRAAEPDAITALGRLAQLRDSGAITAEEFESKKTEMLARV